MTNPKADISINKSTVDETNILPTSNSNSKNSVVDAMKVSSIEKGHRLGNFHNYYTFHPPTFRLDELETKRIYDHAVEHFLERNNIYENNNEEAPSSKRQKVETEENTNMQGKTFSYCDLGCNEGDMTIGVAERILSLYNEKSKVESSSLSIKCLGLDIDQELIDRANEKTLTSDNKSIKSKFQKCNLCDTNDHRSKCSSFLSLNTLNKCCRFDLTTIFSTTMWIHIHAGDDGLRAFLERACEFSEMILIEPQSSKSYRKINKRLRKMNRPDVDTIPNLELRANIESEIEKIVCESGFCKVEMKETCAEGKKKGWDREIQLYKRKTL